MIRFDSLSSSTNTPTTAATFEPLTKKQEEESTSPFSANNDTAKRDLELQTSIKQKQVQQLCKNNESVDAFFDKVFVDSLKRKPQDVNQLDIDCSSNQRLNDYSIEGKKVDLEVAKANLKMLESYDFEGLTIEQKISYRVLQWQLRHQIAGEKFLYHEYFIAHTHGVLNDLIATFTQHHKIEKEKDFENYKLRLQQIPKQLAELKAILQLQYKKGIRLPVFSLIKILSILDPYITPSAKKHPFYIYCEARLDGLQIAEKPALDWLEHILNSSVIPAFEGLKQSLQELSLFTDTNHGLCKLPDGKEYYAYCLQRYTTTNLTIDEMFKLGKNDVTQIQSEIRTLLETLGIKDSNTSVGKLLWIFAKTTRRLHEKRVSQEEDTIRSFHLTLGKSRSLQKMQWQKMVLPLFRKKGDFKAYSEGWELFSETISYERGAYKDPCEKLKYLQYQLFSAVRLIVDIGVHFGGWNIDLAIDYMQRKTGFNRQSVIAEVENCLVNPGQACAAKIGQLKFLEWRKKAEEALGTKFSFPGFCAVIQNTGGVPLTVLEEILRTTKNSGQNEASPTQK